MMGDGQDSNIVNQLRWALNRVNHMVRLAKTSKKPTEKGPISTVQIEVFEKEEVNEDVPYMEHYGFHAVPDAKCDVIAINLAGNNHHSIIIASNDQKYKPKNMAFGETQIYDNKKQSVYLKAGSQIYLTAISGIRLIAPGGVTVENNLYAKGNLAAESGATGSFTSATGNVVTVARGIITNIS